MQKNSKLIPTKPMITNSIKIPPLITINNLKICNLKLNMMKKTFVILMISTFILVGCAEKQETTKTETDSNSGYFDNSKSDEQKSDSTFSKNSGSPVFTPSTRPYPLSTAVQVGDILYLSGVIGASPNGVGVVPGGIEPETHRMFERIKETLASHGLGLEDVFKCTVMLADMSEWSTFNTIYATYFENGKYPTRSAMGVNGLAFGARVELECWAWNPQTN